MVFSVQGLEPRPRMLQRPRHGQRCKPSLVNILTVNADRPASGFAASL